MHCSVIDIRRDSLDGLAVIIDRWVALRLLLVPNIVCSMFSFNRLPSSAVLTLCASLNTPLFHADDRLGKQFASQPRIRAKTLPIPASVSRSAQWTSDRSEGYMRTFSDELVSHVLAASVG